MEANSTKGIRCNICKKAFKQRKSIYTHTRRVHGIELRPKGYLLCPINDCNEKFAVTSALRKHLSISHHKKIETEEYVFKSRIEFLQWKESIEKSDKLFYVLSSSKKLADGSKKSYYVCHRSSSRCCPKKTTRTRAARFQLCTKMGSHCPSTLDVNEKENEVRVIYHKTHVGHDIELKNLSLSNLERSALANVINSKQNMASDGS